MSVKKYNFNDLFQLFEESVSVEDVLASKLMSQVSSAITRERIKRRENQEEFAKRIHASQSQISRWEKGDYNFSINKIAEIAAALDLDVDISMYSAAMSSIHESVRYRTPAAFTMIASSKAKSSDYSDTNYVPASSFISSAKEEFHHASIC